MSAALIDPLALLIFEATIEPNRISVDYSTGRRLDHWTLQWDSGRDAKTDPPDRATAVLRTGELITIADPTTMHVGAAGYVWGEVR